MIQDCSGISQWTTDSEIAWLSELSTRVNSIAEVGSYKGKSAKAISWVPRKNHVVYCIDRFQDNTEQDFRKNLAAEIDRGQVELLPCESEEGARRIATFHPSKLPLDAVFIDGSHEKHDVLRDIQIWTPLVKKGGWICGHDCYPGEPDNGIDQALQEVNPEYHLVIDSIWAYKNI